MSDASWITASRSVLDQQSSTLEAPIEIGPQLLSRNSCRHSLERRICLYRDYRGKIGPSRRRPSRELQFGWAHCSFSLSLGVRVRFEFLLHRQLVKM